MRKTIVTLGLVAAILFTAANEASAQRRGFGRRGGFGIGSGYYGSPYYYGGQGYYSGYYGGQGYYPYNSGYYGGRGYSPYYSGSYGSNYNYSTPGYYSDSVSQVPQVDSRQSFYSDPNIATLTVMVPNPDAQIWVDDAPTSQRGTERTFYTPSLQQAGTYTIKARWMEGGRAVDQQRTVRVQPGQSVTVDFRSEPVANPRPPKQ